MGLGEVGAGSLAEALHAFVHGETRETEPGRDFALIQAVYERHHRECATLVVELVEERGGGEQHQRIEGRRDREAGQLFRLVAFEGLSFAGPKDVERGMIDRAVKIREGLFGLAKRGAATKERDARVLDGIFGKGSVAQEHPRATEQERSVARVKCTDLVRRETCRDAGQRLSVPCRASRRGLRRRQAGSPPG